MGHHWPVRPHSSVLPHRAVVSYRVHFSGSSSQMEATDGYWWAEGVRENPGVVPTLSVFGWCLQRLSCLQTYPSFCSPNFCQPALTKVFLTQQIPPAFFFFFNYSFHIQWYFIRYLQHLRFVTNLSSWCASNSKSNSGFLMMLISAFYHLLLSFSAHPSFL